MTPTPTKTHFRVCHLCGFVNSADGTLVTQCQDCGKHLAPFCFFDESRALGINSNVYSTEDDSQGLYALPHKEYPPVYGLTVYWES